MGNVTVYRCSGCDTRFRIVGETQPRIVCRECDREADLTGNPRARREYRLGHARYVEGRRRFTTGLEKFEDGHLTLARGDLDAAAGEFEQSVDHFTTGTRQAESDHLDDLIERARKKATCLWQAVEWLSGASFAREQDRSTLAAEYQHDARRRIEAARDYGDLCPPSELQGVDAIES